MTVQIRRPRTKRLTMFESLTAYLGGKRRLVGVLFREIANVVPRRHWPGLGFYDAFMGGASVSMYAKALGFDVTSTDIALRSVTVGRALIENTRVKLVYEDVLELARDQGEPPGTVERDMCPSIFGATQARFLDRALQRAERTEDPAKSALFRLLAIRFALTCHPMSQVRSGTAHRITAGEFENVTESCLPRYVAALRLARPEQLWEMAQAINAGVFEGRGRVYQASCMEMLPRIQPVVMYADPPYAKVMSYEREYKVIDRMLEGLNRPTSPFTAPNGADVIDSLLERALHVPLWVLSFGNAATTLEALEEKMKRHGRRTRALEITYAHLPAVARREKTEANREYLVIGSNEAELSKRGLLTPTESIDLGTQDRTEVSE